MFDLGHSVHRCGTDEHRVGAKCRALGRGSGSSAFCRTVTCLRGRLRRQWRVTDRAREREDSNELFHSCLQGKPAPRDADRIRWLPPIAIRMLKSSRTACFRVGQQGHPSTIAPLINAGADAAR